MTIGIITHEGVDENRLVFRQMSDKLQLFDRHPVPHHPGCGQQTIIVATVKYPIAMITVRKTVIQLLRKRMTTVRTRIYHHTIYAANKRKNDGQCPSFSNLLRIHSSSVVSSASSSRTNSSSSSEISSSSSSSATEGNGTWSPEPLRFL